MKKAFFIVGAIIILIGTVAAVLLFLPGLQAGNTFKAANNAELTAPPNNSQVPAKPAPTTAAQPPVVQAPTPAPEPQYVSLLFGGDVMAHQKQIDSHKFGSSYDFKDDYKYISETISAADIALVNLETPVSGEGPYAGWPHFNAPDSIADALLYAGFDVIATANNHMRDQRDDAMRRTCSFLQSKGFEVIGTASDEDDVKYALIEKNGIKIGFVNFTKSLNCGYPDSAQPYVNCLRIDGKAEAGLEMLAAEISALKDQGADS